MGDGENMNYINVNVKMTKKLLAKLEDDVYVYAKKRNKLNTYKFIEGIIDRNSRVIDIGCRDGLWMEILFDNGYTDLFCIDVCKEALQISAQKGFCVDLCDAQDLYRYDAKKYDFVSIIHTLEHCPDVDLVLKGIKRLLKHSGYLLVVVPIQKKEPVPTIWAHYHCFSSAEEVMKHIENCGFEKIKIQTGDKGHNRFLYRRK